MVKSLKMKTLLSSLGGLQDSVLLDENLLADYHLRAMHRDLH